MLRNRVDGQFCFPRTGLEDALLRRIRQIEEAVLGKPLLSVFVWTWPGTTLTIEPANVVNLQEGLWGPHHPHIANPIQHRVPDRRNPRRFFRGRSYFYLAECCWILRLQGDRSVRIELLFRAILTRCHLEQVFFHTVMPVSTLIISLDYGGAVKYLHRHSLLFHQLLN